MGQHAEDLLDWEYRTFARPYDPFFDGPLEQTRAKWNTANGDTLYVDEMESGHIQNCINHLARQGRPAFPPLQEELDKRATNANNRWK